MQTMSNILSLAIWIPVAFGILLLVAGRQQHAGIARWVALIGSVISFLVTLPLMTDFDTTTAAMQFVEKASWIERFNVFYHLGVDGISMWFVPLTAFITIIVVLAGWEVIEDRPHQYYGAFLILSGLMVGVFSALDGMLFYVFFEATLIPMYIIIGIWGGPRRVYAAFKFFLYTLLGSLLMLIALVYLYYKSGGSFDILTWHKLPLPATPQALLFGAFFAAFAVKVPMWPVHTWLPDAHVEAPTGGSIVLAAIMLKLGCYGFLRFMLPIVPDASHQFAPVVITLSLIAVIYIGLVAMVQQDMKKLVAYSSIAHMGFVTLGFFVFNELGVSGGLVQMISHGFVSGAMFLAIGVLSTGAAWIFVRQLSAPLKRLVFAARQLGQGRSVRLPASDTPSEMAEVYRAFNQMAEDVEQGARERELMLAGVSHDLRTPLTRLRLETEMSVQDDIAREHMVADIVQLDATIDKFLDYARPDHVTLTPVNLHAVVSSCVYAVQDHRELQITMQVPEDLNVLADEVELARVISNLLENARRYGKAADTGVTSVDIAAKGRESWVLLKLRDHGAGVPPEQLSNLTKPFFRGDSARTAAAGAGLGLSIVDKTVQRMGGIFALANSSTGGLVAHIQLQRATELPAGVDPKQRLQRPAIKRQLPRKRAQDQA